MAIPEETSEQSVPIVYVSVDGTGVPMRKEELEGRAGKQENGKSKTRQVYLGCVFTQHTLDEQGYPIRDHDSTSYLSGFQSSCDFGVHLRQEAIRRGMGNAEKTVMLVDGASGLEKMGRDCFKEAEQIVDYYHATEHVEQVLCALLGAKTHPDYPALYEQWTERLLRDEVVQLIEQTREQCPVNSLGPVEDALHYFENNIDRMQYGTYREKGYFIGSGVIERYPGAAL